MKTFKEVCLEVDYMRLYVELCYFNRPFDDQGSFGFDRKRKSRMSSTLIGIAQGGFLNAVLKSVNREAKARMIGKVSKIDAGLLGPIQYLAEGRIAALKVPSKCSCTSCTLRFFGHFWPGQAPTFGVLGTRRFTLPLIEILNRLLGANK